MSVRTGHVKWTVTEYVPVWFSRCSARRVRCARARARVHTDQGNLSREQPVVVGRGSTFDLLIDMI